MHTMHCKKWYLIIINIYYLFTNLSQFIFQWRTLLQRNIFIEKEDFNHNIIMDSLLKSFKLVFCIFFSFNMEYPRKLQAEATLETIQRYFLKIHPDAGTKSTVLLSETKNKYLII